MKNLFITGGTGFLGKEFIRQVLKKTDYKIYVLAREKKGMPFDERIVRKDERVISVEGDVTYECVFANSEDRSGLEKIIDEVWHIAAITDFRESRRENTFNINHKGTSNLLNQLKSFRRLGCFNFVSTAYTCGLLGEPNTYYEVLANGAGAKNPYEESKQLAEKMVAGSGIPYAIYRPSIIVGSSDGTYSDSKTIYGLFTGMLLGKIAFMNGMDAVDQQDTIIDAKVKMPFPIVGVPTAKKNMIPVDHVARLMLEIGDSRAKEGKIYHLCCPENYEVRTMTDSVFRTLNMDGQYLERKENIDFSSLPYAARKIVSNIEIFNDYMTLSDPFFSLKNTIRQVGERSVLDIPEATSEFFDFLYASFLKSEHGKRFTSS